MTLTARILAVVVGLAGKAKSIARFARPQVLDGLFAGPQGLLLAVQWALGAAFNVAGIALGWAVFQLTAERRT